MRHQLLDVFAKDSYTLEVFSPLRDDKVSITLGGLDELLMHRLENFQIAVDHHRDSTSAVDSVALDIANETLVGVGVNKNLQVHKVAQLLVDERHDAFDDDDRLWFHVNGFGQSVGEYIRIGGLLDGSSLTQFVDLPIKKFPVECIGKNHSSEENR